MKYALAYCKKNKYDKKVVKIIVSYTDNDEMSDWKAKCEKLNEEYENVEFDWDDLNLVMV